MKSEQINGIKIEEDGVTVIVLKDDNSTTSIIDTIYKALHMLERY